MDFRNTIIIMTSNVGTKDIRDIGSFGFGDDVKEKDKHTQLKDTVEDAMKKLFNPEFLNRIDDVVIFNALEREDIHSIIDIELRMLIDRIEDLGYELTITEKAKDYIADKGFDKKYGARPLKRAIQKYIEDALAEEIVNSKLNEGDSIYMDLKNDKLTIKISKGKKKVE